MDSQRFAGSLSVRVAAGLAVLLLGAAIVIDTPSRLVAVLLIPVLFHELVRQSRPILIVSDEFLTWQPRALWHAEVSVRMKDITRVRSKWSRSLSVKLRDGSHHWIKMDGIPLSQRRSIPKILEDRIGSLRD